MIPEDLLLFIRDNLDEIKEAVEGLKPGYGEYEEYAKYYKVYNFCDTMSELITKLYGGNNND